MNRHIIASHKRKVKKRKVKIIYILHLLMHMQNSNLKYRGEYGQPIR